jgi:hypothetical protein
MAHARWLTALIAFVLATVARAAGPCEEGRGQTGLALGIAPEGGLAVVAVDADSSAAASGVSPGDTLVQANATVPESCADYGRAVRDARKGHRALLLLVRRHGAELPLVLAAATWDRAVAVVAPPPAVEAPSVRQVVAAPPPPPLPPETSVTLDEVTRALGTLATPDKLSPRLDTYRRDLFRVHQQVETLAARRSVPAAVVDGLRTVLGYHDAAAIAWASEEAEREREGRSRHVPRDTATAPYFEDSDVAAAIDQFPFLRDTVAREPSPGMVGESAGLWRPHEARTLLWAHGGEELARLTTWLAAGASRTP